MKVSTDACVQGAWAPVASSAKRILDIGCGTGLLSLMIAQKRPDLVIDALEVEASAAQQARENIAESPWGGSIHVQHTDVRDYTATVKYDMIICNPPFFSDDLRGPDEGRNLARHDTSLSQSDLFFVLSHNLSAQGVACVMLPAAEHALWETLLTRQSWHIHRALSVRPLASKRINRVISVAAAFPCGGRKDEVLTIYNSVGVYTEPFRELLMPYYLYL